MTLRRQAPRSSATRSTHRRGGSWRRTAWSAGRTRRGRMTRVDYDKYDLLIGMDSANIRNMTRICGGDPAGKIHRLLDYTARPADVADPWYTGDFSATWRDVAEGCRGLLKAITSQAM